MLKRYQKEESFGACGNEWPVTHMSSNEGHLLPVSHAILLKTNLGRCISMMRGQGITWRGSIVRAQCLCSAGMRRSMDKGVQALA